MTIDLTKYQKPHRPKPPVLEIDVLIATAIWLHKNDCIIKAISIPKNQTGISYLEQEQRLSDKFSTVGISKDSLTLQPEGPDIVASFNDGYWVIECKGWGSGSSSTLETQFNRGLAGVVSYYDLKDIQDGTELRIGFAIPRNDIYLRLIRTHISQSLRKAINLWIFLYNTDTGSIDAIGPNDTSAISYLKMKEGGER